MTAGTTMATIIAYWESDVNAPTWSDTAIVTATSFKTGVVNDGTFGSNDGTFGTVGSAVTTAAGMKGKAGNTMSIKLVNAGTQDLRLDSLHFDYSWTFAAAPTNVTVTLAGGQLDDANGALITTYTGTANISKYNDYADIDVTLSSVLADTVLASGEFATFQFTFGSASGTSASGLDNIAVYGTVIPEPATLGLMASFGAAIIFIRRKMQL